MCVEEGEAGDGGVGGVVDNSNLKAFDVAGDVDGANLQATDVLAGVEESELDASQVDFCEVEEPGLDTFEDTRHIAEQRELNPGEFVCVGLGVPVSAGFVPRRCKHMVAIHEKLDLDTRAFPDEVRKPGDLESFRSPSRVEESGDLDAAHHRCVMLDE